MSPRQTVMGDGRHRRRVATVSAEKEKCRGTPKLMCQLIGQPWELALDRHKGSSIAALCRRAPSSSAGASLDNRSDALLATLQVRPVANACSGHERVGVDRNSSVATCRRETAASWPA